MYQYQITLSQGREDTMRVNSRAFVFNRTADKTTRDWFRITNKKNSDTTEVYIFDEIGFWGTTAQGFVDELKKVKTANIDLHLNSPGGDVFDGVAIYNALKDHDAYVTVVVDALAASAASFIAQAGDKIIMNRGSTMMIHDGLAFCIGNEQDMLTTAVVLSKISNNVADIYAERAGGTIESWRALMREEVWYTAQEAVDANLADEVGSKVAPAEAVEATDKWDLSIFNHAGRDNAPSPAEVIRKIITNRAKEAPVPTKATPRAEATTDTPPDEVTQPVPAATDEPQPDPVTPESTEEDDDEVMRSVNKAGSFTFKLNGVDTADPRAVQTYIDSLEVFARETREENRKTFVRSLAKDNKIVASQLSGIETFALGLSSEQYEAWKMTYDNAPTLSLLGTHAAGSSNHEGDADSVKNAAVDRLDVLKDIVRQHKLSGMTSERIENTASFKELKQLDPDFKL